MTTKMKAEPTINETLGQVQIRLGQLSSELLDMPSWRQNTRWHLDCVGDAPAPASSA